MALNQFTGHGLVVQPTLERLALNPTVLIVEDDPVILMTAAHVLRQAGLHTLEAETADAAVVLLHDCLGAVAAVFSDIETPGRLDGLALAHAVAQSWPSLPVVLTSGRVTPSGDALPAGARFVPKPYDIAAVAALLRGLIESDGRQP